MEEKLIKNYFIIYFILTLPEADWAARLRNIDRLPEFLPPSHVTVSISSETSTFAILEWPFYTVIHTPARFSPRWNGSEYSPQSWEEFKLRAHSSQFFSTMKLWHESMNRRCQENYDIGPRVALRYTRSESIIIYLLYMLRVHTCSDLQAIHVDNLDAYQVDIIQKHIFKAARVFVPPT